MIFDGDATGDGIVDDQDDYAIHLGTLGLNLQSLSVLADLNGDFVVDFDDLDYLYVNDNLPNPTQADGDLDLDGDIDLADLDLAFAQLGLALAVVS